MSEADPQPLWREVVGDVEPWRRGRKALIIFGTVTLLFQIFGLGSAIAASRPDALLYQGSAIVLFWLQFYFIWIGVHWVRWIQGTLCALTGFAFSIWGMLYGSVLVVAVGVYSIGIGCYIAFAPAVYFFAKHQQARRNWTEALIAGGVFVLLLASVGCGLIGLSVFKAHEEEEARHFANIAFGRVFTDHDTYYLLDHCSPALLERVGRGPITQLLQLATLDGGDVHDMDPAVGSLYLIYHFPFQFGAFGVMITRGRGDRGVLQMEMRVVSTPDGWRIDQLSWRYIG